MSLLRIWTQVLVFEQWVLIPTEPSPQPLFWLSLNFMMHKHYWAFVIERLLCAHWPFQYLCWRNIYSNPFVHLFHWITCILKISLFVCVCGHVHTSVYTEARNGHLVFPLSLSTRSSEAGSLPEPGTLAFSSKLKASKLHVSSCIWDARRVSDSSAAWGLGPTLRACDYTEALFTTELSLQPLSDLCFYCWVINLSISWMSLKEVTWFANYFLLSLKCTFQFLVTFGSQSF